MNKDWWKKSIVYEIYIRSFQDSNGDGIGDLRGILQRLDYFVELGVDVLWITPIFESPNDDNGYDISDYKKIMETFGTMDDFEELVETAHQKGLKIMMDLVVNHTSDEHAWFIESKKGQKNTYSDYYIWKNPVNGGVPNNWTSCFGGSAWEYSEERKQYYLHLFSKKQPDLNWDNPSVRSDIHRIMTWWLNKKIDGFRMDVISLISKSPEGLCKDSHIKGHQVSANGPYVHTYLQELHQEVFTKASVVTVGETPAVTVEEAIEFAKQDGNELNMVFQFELMDVDGAESGKWNDQHYQLKDIKRVMKKWQTGLHDKAWNSLFWNNHDQPRLVSRFGDTTTPETWNASAKMLAACLYLMQGTPYIYQGEEIGMTNISFTSIDEYRDIESIQAYQELVVTKKEISKEKMMQYLHKSSRDNARTPMQWDCTAHGGFSPAQPWIKENTNYTSINVEAQKNDGNSIFNFYKELLHFRKESDCICNGLFEEIATNDSLYCYKRIYHNETITVLCNFTNEMQPYLDEEKGLPRLQNYKNFDKQKLQPYEVRVYTNI